MNDRDETTREIEALRERVSKLSAASLRIGPRWHSTAAKT